MTAAESADYITYEEVFDHIAARDVFSDENIASRIEAFRYEHRSRFYYDIDRPGRDFAMVLHDLAGETHQHLVEFADAHSRCGCDHRNSSPLPRRQLPRAEFAEARLFVVQRLDNSRIVIAGVVDLRRNLVGVQIGLRIRLTQFLAGVRVCGEPVGLNISW